MPTNTNSVNTSGTMPNDNVIYHYNPSDSTTVVFSPEQMEYLKGFFMAEPKKRDRKVKNWKKRIQK